MKNFRLAIFLLITGALIAGCASQVNKLGESTVEVKGQGDTVLENTVVRWMVDSEPRGADVFWRIVSSHPDVNNTNESHMGKTPFEETRSFDIKGLSEASAGNIQVEIRVERDGYYEQRKRYNFQQAIEQKEISGYFNLEAEDAP